MPTLDLISLSLLLVAMLCVPGSMITYSRGWNWIWSYIWPFVFVGALIGSLVTFIIGASHG